jgi:predicted ester cyclase
MLPIVMQMRSSLVLALIGVFVAGGASAANAVTEQARNKTAVTRYLNSLDGSDGTAVARQVLSPGYRLLRAEFSNLAINAKGSQFEKTSQPLAQALADRSTTIVRMIAEGDRVAVQYRIRGRHKANLYGIAATGKEIDIDAGAIFKLADGRITEGWFMADEAGLLLQLGVTLPARSDGLRPSAPAGDARPGDEVLGGLLAHPVDSPAYRNTLRVAAYKSGHPPAGILPASGSPFAKISRHGFTHLAASGTQLGQGDKATPQAFPARLDKIESLIAEGNLVAIQFQVTGTNTKTLYGLPPSNTQVAVYEFAIMTFEGDAWTDAWFLGDDLGMLQQLSGPPDFWFISKTTP